MKVVPIVLSLPKLAFRIYDGSFWNSETRIGSILDAGAVGEKLLSRLLWYKGGGIDVCVCGSRVPLGDVDGGIIKL